LVWSAPGPWGTASPGVHAGGIRRAADRCGTTSALERARGSIEKSLGKFVEKGKLTSPARDEALARLSSATSIDVLADADYVIEAIFEDLEAKRGLFARLDQITRPHVILSSNTSSISITLLGAATTRPDKVLGHALHEPGAADDAGGVDPRTGHVARVDARGDRALHAAEQDGGRSGRLSRLHRQPHPDADDQRGGLRLDGRRRHRGLDRHRS
jgi:hypothetical protein